MSTPRPRPFDFGGHEATAAASVSDVGWFAAAFLASVLARSLEGPRQGLIAAAVAGAVLAVEGGALVAAARRRGSATVAAAAAGMLAGLVVPAATPRPERPRAADVAARPEVVEISGVVDRVRTPRDGVASFRLAGGPEVRVHGAAAAPLPGSTVAVVGRRDADGARVTAFSPEAVRVEPPPPFHVPASVESLRRRLLDRLHRAAPSEAGDVLAAVLLGEPSLPRALREDLADAGALHLVAVSGSHLSMALVGLRLATPRLRWILPLLTTYAALTGFAAPVMRSLVVAAGATLGRRWGRRADDDAHLLFAAAVVLAWDPPALFDAGFQLSFAAFFGLRCALPRREEESRLAAALADGAAVPRKFRDAVRAGLGAALMAAPPTLLHFGQLAPYGPFATLLLAPLIPALLLLAVGATALPELAVWEGLATPTVALATFVARAVAGAPFAAASLARPTSAGTALCVFAVVRTTLRMRLGAVGRTDALLLLASFAAILAPDRATPGVYALDVGRGSATLLLGRRGAVLADAGPLEGRVARALAELGVDRLDAVVVSHAHEDHAGGLPEVVERLCVGEVLTAPRALTAVRALAGSAAPRCRAISAGAEFRSGDVAFRAVWPPSEARSADPNDDGLVLDARVGALTAWVSGDAEAAPLRDLLLREPPGPRDLLTLPHHGSANDGLADLLAATRPRGLLLSARAGFPDPSVLRLVAATGLPLAATYVHGTICAPAPPEAGESE